MLGVKILEWKAHGYLYGLEWQDITIIWVVSVAIQKNKSAHGMLVP